MDHPKWVSSLCGRLNIVIYYAGMIIVGTMCGHQARAGTGGGELSLVFSTYLGGSGGDYIRDVTTDRNGNIYLAGYTASPNFPTTPGAYDRTFNGWHDVIVAKLDPVGKLQWSTFIGGPNFDLAMAIEVDSQGYVYIAGSAGPGFPVSAGAFQTTFQGYYTGSAYGNQNAFAAKLKPDGSALVWASYFGPVARIRDLAIDQNGDIFVGTASETAESNPFPSAWFSNAFQRTRKGPSDTVVAKIASNGSQVRWATYFGGSGQEGSDPAVRVDAAGYVYLLTITASTDLPTTVGAYDRAYAGNWDMALAKFTPNGANLVYGTYLGGSQVEFTETHGLAVDAQGNAYILGTTKSPDFPTTPGAFQKTYGGSGGSGTGASSNYSGDGFVSKISADGSQLLASTFVGGRYGEGIEGVGIDAQGNIYFSGATYSANFPVTPDAFQGIYKGGADFFAVKLAADFSRLLYSTYLGGSSADYGRAAHVDSNGNFYVVGQTQSNNWPTFQALQAARAGNWDAALAKFAPWINTVSPAAPTGLVLR